MPLPENRWSFVPAYLFAFVRVSASKSGTCMLRVKSRLMLGKLYLHSRYEVTANDSDSSLPPIRLYESRNCRRSREENFCSSKHSTAARARACMADLSLNSSRAKLHAKSASSYPLNSPMRCTAVVANAANNDMSN
eukprot:gnl/MRDRNA2_/MRDRNA2_85310_c0_seq5.p2 gnl/MRDRNA2_/MRDRNA2_85310_c0~~gnl/MRDRNA2_/MRDRNA2_85310_c0_seq5.p2  ORF type:complete len:136 (+),score=7.06 gnl/MRDRNA2_/MRDRNA2_85310_c0_seq5:740-1147(+)